MIIPAILSDSIEEVQHQLELSVAVGFPRVQVDIIDPEFADNVTINPIDLALLQLHDLRIDVHLMTNEPSNDVVECSHIPGITTIIAQIERMSSQPLFVEHVKSVGAGVGFSLDLYTPIEAIEQESFASARIIQVMANKAGEQGKEFAGQVVLEKIATLREMKTELGYSFVIGVDIGMNPSTIAMCKKAGANEFAVGSFLWNAPSLSDAVHQLAGV